ncbi:DUF1893 domain-containing protein [Pseudolactococcus yaeyamensis]
MNEFETEHYSILALTQSGQYSSRAGGILPILKPLVNDAAFFEQAVVIDKVIGKAAALLLIKGKVKFIHGNLMSLSAKETLEKAGIDFSYHQLCQRIQNKTQTDICPMEASVLEVGNPEIAYQILSKKLSHVLYGE